MNPTPIAHIVSCKKRHFLYSNAGFNTVFYCYIVKKDQSKKDDYQLIILFIKLVLKIITETMIMSHIALHFTKLFHSGVILRLIEIYKSKVSYWHRRFDIFSRGGKINSTVSASFMQNLQCVVQFSVTS